MANEVERMSPHSGQAYDKDSNVIDLVSCVGVLSCSIDQRKVLDGESNVATHIFTLSSGATGVLHFKTGSKKVANVYAFLADDDIEYSVYSAPTLTDDGTQALIANRKLYDAQVPTANVYYAPAITDDGTLLTKRRSIAGSPIVGNLTGGDSRLLCIPENHSVLYKFENLGNAVCTITVEIDWIETDL